MSLGEKDIIQRARAGELREIIDRYDLTPGEVRKITHPNSEDGEVFDYAGHPEAQAQILVDSREGEGGETADIPPGSEDAGQRAMDGAGIAKPEPGE